MKLCVFSLSASCHLHGTCTEGNPNVRADLIYARDVLRCIIYPELNMNRRCTTALPSSEPPLAVSLECPSAASHPMTFPIEAICTLLTTDVDAGKMTRSCMSKDEINSLDGKVASASKIRSIILKKERGCE